VFGRRSFDFARQVAVMAIINRTPELFITTGAGRSSWARPLPAADCAVAAGADWLDVGGAPFSPDCATTEDEELDRVIPLVEAVRSRTDAVISVDTTRPEVARQVLARERTSSTTRPGCTTRSSPTSSPRAAGDSSSCTARRRPRTHLRRPEYDDVVEVWPIFW
jgi:dihydropteroate synthase